MILYVRTTINRNKKKIKVCLWKTMPLTATKSKKLFLNSWSKSTSQDHWPWCHLKGCHQWCMHVKYEVFISYSSKVIAKVKVDNKQTDKQTGQKQYAPDHLIRGIKIAFNTLISTAFESMRCVARRVVEYDGRQAKNHPYLSMTSNGEIGPWRRRHLRAIFDVVTYTCFDVFNDVAHTTTSLSHREAYDIFVYTLYMELNVRNFVLFADFLM